MKENAPCVSTNVCFIDEYRLLGVVPSQGGRNKLELALWDTWDKNPSPVRFKTKQPPAESTRLGRNRKSNHELPFHGDLSQGIVCVGNREGTSYKVLVIQVRDLIALSEGRGGTTVQWSQWKSMVTKLSGIPSRYFVLHSQVAYVDQENKTPVLHIHDFSRHLEWDSLNHKHKLISHTPTTPKKIKLLHKDMKHASKYRFDVTEGCVYATPVS